MLTISLLIVDFGLCADFSDGQRVSMVGSPFWIPPEMIREEPHSFPVRFSVFVAISYTPLSSSIHV